MTRHRGVVGAALVAGALLLLEDPAAIAVRHRLAPQAPSAAVDATLAATMLAYNYVASRYVVSAASTAHVMAALSRLDEDRTAGAGRLRRAARGLDPLRVVRAAADRAGALAGRASAHATRRRRHRLARGLADLAAVNLLGVPGVGLEQAVRGRGVSRLDSFRHAALFVVSWFAGARLVETVVRAGERLPLAGTAVRPTVRAVGRVVGALTDVRAPLGLVTVAIVLAVVVRLARRIDRMAADQATQDASALSGGGAPGPGSRDPSWPRTP